MKKYFIALFLLFLSSCDRGDICDRDKFFCQPRVTWISAANSLPTSRVYKLHLDLQSHFRPGDYELLHVLGKRGHETIDAMIVDIDNRKDDSFNDITAMLTAVKSDSGYDICTDTKRRQLLVKKINDNNRVNTSIVNDFCQS